MRPRLPIRRILFLRPFRPPNTLRPFTQNTLTPQLRPQLPFLSSPSRRPRVRWLTTETKQWVKSEFKLAVKWTLVLWTVVGLVGVTATGLVWEYVERTFPTPREWSFLSRMSLRDAKWAEDDSDEDRIIKWPQIWDGYRQVIARLEDPNIDGADLQEQDEGGILVAGVGKTGFDISKKSEPWRRGYYDALMGAGRSAEHIQDWVVDKSRNLAFPTNTMIGPSNPNPRPVHPGQIAPKEEDCEASFPPPETYYMRILTTHGFTEKQRVDAALAYGTWLEYKGTPNTAFEMYKWALDIATESSTSPKPIIDKTAYVLNTDAGLPSANVLAATTALAVHHAVNSNLNLALPIFLSILRARKSLPDAPTTMRSTLTPDEETESTWKTAMSLIRSIMVQPPFPPPPDDGTRPPQRTPKERCEEAGIMTYVGEILYASKQSKTSREDGLAWTREAVDIAEEELRGKGIDKEGKKTCKQCLEVGLENWMTMVTKLAREEKELKAGKSSGWLGFGGEIQQDVKGRWESEEQVIEERVRRASEIMRSST